MLCTDDFFKYRSATGRRKCSVTFFRLESGRRWSSRGPHPSRLLDSTFFYAKFDSIVLCTYALPCLDSFASVSESVVPFIVFLKKFSIQFLSLKIRLDLFVVPLRTAVTYHHELHETSTKVTMAILTTHCPVLLFFYLLVVLCSSRSLNHPSNCGLKPLFILSLSLHGVSNGAQRHVLIY
jgi:hypothetical protein